MCDKKDKMRKDECDATMEPDKVADIDDFCKDNHVTKNCIDDNDAGETVETINNDYDIDDIDDLMIAQSKAQIRSDYRRSLGKEFVRRPR